MARTLQKSFRYPVEVAKMIESHSNATEFVTQAIREKVERERYADMVASLGCLANEQESENFESLQAGQRKVMSLVD